MVKPFAITLDVGSSLANKTGRGGPTARSTSTGCRVQPRVSGRREHPASGCSTRSPATTKPPGMRWSRTTRCPRSWAASATTRAKVRATAGSSTRRSASIGRALPGRRGAEARLEVQGAGGRDGQARAGRRRGTLGTVGGLPPAAAWPCGEDRRGGPLTGGMMRFGIPKYRLPRDVLDGEVARIAAMGVEIELNRKVTDIVATMRDEGFDAAFLAVGAHIAKRAYIPAGEAARMLDAVSVLRSMEGDEKPMLGRRVVVYAAATRRSTSPARRSAWARPRRSSSTGARGRRCPRTTSRSRRRCRKAC